MGISWESEVLDLTQLVMVIQKQLKMTSFIMPNNYCFNNLAQKINPKIPRGSPWSLPYSWESEVLDLAQMVMAIRKQLKLTSVIIPNNYCFNKLALKSIPGIPGVHPGHCPTPGSLSYWTSP